MNTHYLRAARRWICQCLLFAMPLLLLTACFEEEKTSTSYSGANHTDKAAMFVTINGAGGIMNVNEHGLGGDVCCVDIPKKWRPDLTVKIGWQDDGTWLLDAQGHEVIRNGRTVLVETPRKFKVVPVPKYDKPATLWIHFFPNDEIKIVMSDYWPGHPKHGLPSPE
jgi:hypothetical protein